MVGLDVFHALQLVRGEHEALAVLQVWHALMVLRELLLQHVLEAIGRVVDADVGETASEVNPVAAARVASRRMQTISVGRADGRIH